MKSKNILLLLFLFATPIFSSGMEPLAPATQPTISNPTTEQQSIDQTQQQQNPSIRLQDFFEIAVSIILSPLLQAKALHERSLKIIGQIPEYQQLQKEGKHLPKEQQEELIRHCKELIKNKTDDKTMKDLLGKKIKELQINHHNSSIIPHISQPSLQR